MGAVTGTTMLAAAISGALAAAGVVYESRGIEAVAWLQGCWVAVSGDRVVEEQWMAPRGGSMVGASRTVRGDRLVEYELIVLRREGDALVYHAHPSGQPSARFVAREVGADRVLFENPAHDFPQRIGYERREDRLLAWIEGRREGRDRRVEFPYRRVPCPAGTTPAPPG